MKERGEFICPNCGETVPTGAKACPECGSDERTGWSEGTIYDGTGVEEPKKFDYDEWLREEGVVPKRFSTKRLIVVVIVLLLVASLGWFLWR